MHILKLLPLFFCLPLVASVNLPQREELKKPQPSPTFQKKEKEISQIAQQYKKKLFIIEITTHATLGVLYTIAYLATIPSIKKTFLTNSIKRDVFLKNIWKGVIMCVVALLIFIMPSLLKRPAYYFLKSPPIIQNYKNRILQPNRIAEPICFVSTFLLVGLVEYIRFLLLFKGKPKPQTGVYAYQGAQYFLTLSFSMLLFLETWCLVGIFYPFLSLLVKYILYKRTPWVALPTSTQKPPQGEENPQPLKRKPPQVLQDEKNAQPVKQKTP